MRARSEKCVVTFRTTAGAMAMEAACRAVVLPDGGRLPGRLIPVPRSIAAGCGLCWAGPPDTREALEELVIRKRLDVDGIYMIIL